MILKKIKNFFFKFDLFNILFFFELVIEGTK